MTVTTVSRDVVQRGENDKFYVLEASKQQYYGSVQRRFQCRARQTFPRFDLVQAGRPVALDVEGVLLPDETSIGKCGVGRVSITNEDGEVVYDVFAFYPDNVNSRPSPQRLNLGVKYKDIMPCYGARPVSEVLRNAEQVFKKSGIVVCHAIINEIRYMSARELLTYNKEFVNTHGFDLTQFRTYDTQTFKEYREFGTGHQRLPRLAVLAEQVLNRAIQVQEHSSVEDAQATMDLFLRRKEEFEATRARGRLPETPDVTTCNDVDDDEIPPDCDTAMIARIPCQTV